jgi:hypothetical protein
MKVRKEVSLTVETAQIANKMNNFSQWVRIGLRQYQHGEDVASETMRRMRYRKACVHLASTLIDYATQIDPDYKGEVEAIIAQAMNQTTLEEFE